MKLFAFLFFLTAPSVYACTVSIMVSEYSCNQSQYLNRVLSERGLSSSVNSQFDVRYDFIETSRTQEGKRVRVTHESVLRILDHRIAEAELPRVRVEQYQYSYKVSDQQQQQQSFEFQEPPCNESEYKEIQEKIEMALNAIQKACMTAPY